MRNVFEKEYDLRTSDFNCRSKLQPASVLDLFQTVAGEHANELGCGFKAMSPKNMLWVVVRTKYEVLKDADMFGRIKVKTWPLPPSRVAFQREYLIENSAGEPIIKGTSEWVVMHSKERKLMVAKDVYPLEEFCTEKMFDSRMQKLHDFEVEGDGYTILPGFSQLDMNQHVNNTKYANYALDASDISPDEDIKAFQIDFRHEVQAGTRLKVFTTRTDGDILAKGVNAAGEVMFECKMEMK